MTTYLYGGLAAENRFLKSIEWLTLDKFGKPELGSHKWVILTYDAYCSPRNCMLMAPIGPESILILGGNNDRNMLADGMVLNTQTMQPRNTIVDCSMRFACGNNQYSVAENGDVLCLAAVEDGTKKLIKVANYGKTVTI
mmetsp:Transcript_4960/g.6592  ORF Transcript_4960/g.6592 Transcript_4960/m.6592 type:complete len:139 (+) Transcript_4960:691-1107(+)|eukprot:CAMPEP_0185591400 /NCGR_PEP_ID=MMETSP0434-20130131/64397_1 /TAXON_ID=626734 ORGANISM="Favella taraikaensis, Strain Fe Narragansett Bay" /NCGR_SAMPLE_ID=MMETSP0434 /ASSEMBLY_ACC=CAM_ASM_000379 /LENGTH=138 /DNA_ID=CAMNT_0028216371 /DNA_START=403 /DNA_END=819 /DNA_ORIENTATION=+